MAYNENLADRIREALAHLPKVEEKKMFRGVAFLVDEKMCINVSGDEMMCRFDPALQETIAEKNGFRTMIMKGRVYKGYGYISQDGIKSKKDFDYWINLCLEFNKKVKATKQHTNKSINPIDKYITTFPIAIQKLLEQLRQTILKTAPKAQEVISYKIPAYKYHGMLVYFAGYENHIGFYPTPSGIEKFKKELSEYKTAKGSIQFPIDKPLPLKLISKIVKFRVKENQEKAEVKAISKHKK
jgi:uncharacterized protein YdhG (YjbR/CyaY superfamily)/TfoX/Sxy family transcriptional regulator of competence genes